MKLSQPEIELFYKLWYNLVWSINEKHIVIPRFKRPIYGSLVTVSIEEFMKIRNAMWDKPQWIDEFLADHDNGKFTEQERGIILDWRKHFVKSKFLVMKNLAKYTVLMTFGKEPALLYGVYGISDPIKDSFPYPAPFPVELVLLPFKDKIIYDSIAATYNISFGPGMRSSAKEWYNEAKSKHGIIEVLDGQIPVPQPQNEKPKKKTVKKAAPAEETVTVPEGVNVPKSMSVRYMEVAEIIEGFCNEKLDAEYKGICLRALQKLCRKRPSPLISGKASTWACGIVYAIGQHNYIFDKSQPIHIKTASVITDWFGISPGTASGKAKEIRKILGLNMRDWEFSLKSHIDDNPAIWLLSVNGLPVDIRNAPYGAQEEAFRRGMIPYIPADREN